MKPIKLVLLACFAFCLNVNAQNFSISGSIGEDEATQVIMIGNDDDNFYCVLISKDGKDNYGSVEAYSISTLRKVWSVGFSPKSIDPEFEEINKFLVSDLGPVLFYTKYNKETKTAVLSEAHIKNDGSGNWDHKEVLSLKDVKRLDKCEF